MTGDELMTLIDAISCTEAVIENVSAQIISGWTELGSHGNKSYAAEPSTALDKASRAIADASSEIAKREIAKAVDAAKRAEQSASEAWEKYHAMRGELPRVGVLI